MAPWACFHSVVDAWCPGQCCQWSMRMGNDLKELYLSSRPAHLLLPMMFIVVINGQCREQWAMVWTMVGVAFHSFSLRTWAARSSSAMFCRWSCNFWQLWYLLCLVDGPFSYADAFKWWPSLVERRKSVRVGVLGLFGLVTVLPTEWNFMLSFLFISGNLRLCWLCRSFRLYATRRWWEIWETGLMVSSRGL